MAWKSRFDLFISGQVLLVFGVCRVGIARGILEWMPPIEPERFAGGQCPPHTDFARSERSAQCVRVACLLKIGLIGTIYEPKRPRSVR